MFAQQMYDLGVAGARGQHQGGLMVLVQGWAGVLVTCFQQAFAYIFVAQRCGEVQVGVGEA